MDDPAQELGERATGERRAYVASWMAEHLRPAAHALAESEPAPQFEAREYQLDALAALWESRRNGQSRALLEMATGLGKTFVAAVDFMKIREEWQAAHPRKPLRALFVCHRHEINEQARQDFLDVMAELETDLFRTKRTRLPPVDIRFATYQSVLSELHRFGPKDYGHIIYDEAHHSEAETFSRVRGHFRPKTELALTATPDRMDELNIREYFGEPVYRKDLAEAMAEGLLANVDYHIVFDDAVKAVMESGFDPKTLQELYELLKVQPRNEVIAQNIIGERAKIGLGNAKTIVFCQDVEQADVMAELLGGQAYHSKVPKRNRGLILTDFRNGDCQIITTRDMVNEGVNVPDAALIVFLRSTGSEAVFLQQLGRGLRGRGKLVTVLDFAANVERIARIKTLSDSIRHHATRLGDETNENIGRATSEAGLQTHTSHTDFEFDRLVVNLLERFSALRESSSHLHKREVTRALTDDQIIQQALLLSPDQPLEYRRIDELSKEGRFPSTQAIRIRFGSVAAFHRMCGFEVAERVARRFTSDSDPESLVAAALRLQPDRPITEADLNELSRTGDFVSKTIIRRLFGSLTAFQRACGFDAREPARAPSDMNSLSGDEVVALALRISPERAIGTREIEQLASQGNFVGTKRIRGLFGSIGNFQRACGFMPQKGGRPRSQ